MKKFIIGAIRFYQRKISPLFGPKCRYQPTCSQYALEAVERFGVFKGSILALLRLLRCNIFFTGGYDPVPEKKKK
ncbi:MAG: membrane protein insertion efficiency factor YidD [Oscillospiraceae bacterium]|nr:membrane protein insertion efficiency factor YidD [Oscillospiraceae bacterium]